MNNPNQQVSVLFVCMGNICRSPTAEAVFRHFVAEAGLVDRIRVDSAGTHAYHVGDPPDRRSRAAAERRGYVLDDIRARRVEVSDFDSFDYVIAMDRDNQHILSELAGDSNHEKIHLFLSFSKGEDDEVPDPYYGGASGFERVLDMVEEASRAMLASLRSRYSI
ncbi:MAG TPA: low molecular weight protein-tyrosine-phosphatase [Woeseiaceae bacterium]|nr:low molecular weight protein-tyrosine-phosphatase [Woeseiaceae bacterium]